MYWICYTNKISTMDDLTQEEEKRLYKLSKGSDKSFVKNVNRKELNYLFSLVDRQDAQSSYAHATYINELDNMDKILPKK